MLSNRERPALHNILGQPRCKQLRSIAFGSMSDYARTPDYEKKDQSVTWVATLTTKATKADTDSAATQKDIVKIEKSFRKTVELLDSHHRSCLRRFMVEIIPEISQKLEGLPRREDKVSLLYNELSLRAERLGGEFSLDLFLELAKETDNYLPLDEFASDKKTLKTIAYQVKESDRSLNLSTTKESIARIQENIREKIITEGDPERRDKLCAALLFVSLYFGFVHRKDSEKDIQDLQKKDVGELKSFLNEKLGSIASLEESLRRLFNKKNIGVMRDKHRESSERLNGKDGKNGKIVEACKSIDIWKRQSDMINTGIKENFSKDYLKRELAEMIPCNEKVLATASILSELHVLGSIEMKQLVLKMKGVSHVMNKATEAYRKIIEQDKDPEVFGAELGAVKDKVGFFSDLRAYGNSQNQQARAFDFQSFQTNYIDSLQSSIKTFHEIFQEALEKKKDLGQLRKDCAVPAMRTMQIILEFDDDLLRGWEDGRGIRSSMKEMATNISELYCAGIAENAA